MKYFSVVWIYGGVEYLDYPIKGEYKELDLNFLDSDITGVIMARPETASFKIGAIMSDIPLHGEAICKTSEGKSIITIDKGVLKFGFNPMSLYVSKINEG